MLFAEEDADLIKAWIVKRLENKSVRPTAFTCCPIPLTFART